MKLTKLYSQPSYEISSKNKLLNSFLQNRLLSLSIDDHLDTYIDQLTLSFDNRRFKSNQSIPPPQSGKNLHLKLGYLPLVKDFGDFYIDSWSVSAPPATLQITAKSIDITQAFFNQQTQIWKKETQETEKTIADVVKTIAKKHNLKLEISPVYEKTTVQEYQYVESDIHFLSRLAKQYNAFHKIKQNKLFFKEYDELNSLSNKKNTVVLTPKNISSWQVTHQEGENYTCVQAYWYDYDNAIYRLESFPAIADSKSVPATPAIEKKFTIREIFSIQEEARYATKAKYRLLARNKQIITMKSIGNPKLGTGKNLQIKQFQDEINGHWIIQRIQHTFDSGGYVSNVNAYRYT